MFQGAGDSKGRILIITIIVIVAVFIMLGCYLFSTLASQFIDGVRTTTALLSPPTSGLHVHDYVLEALQGTYRIEKTGSQSTGTEGDDSDAYEMLIEIHEDTTMSIRFTNYPAINESRFLKDSMERKIGAARLDADGAKRLFRSADDQKEIFDNYEEVYSLEFLHVPGDESVASRLENSSIFVFAKARKGSEPSRIEQWGVSTLTDDVWLIVSLDDLGIYDFAIRE